MRKGISLLEVLIAIFVILVGLLGIVALIPIGHGNAQKAMTHDRAAALGRAVLAEVAVRDLLDSSRWCFADGTDFDPDPATPVVGSQPFILDPLYAMENSGTAGVNWFPSAPTASDPQILPRMSFHGMSLDLAKRLCICRDDLLFQASDRESRPQAVQETNASVSHKGDYSWILLVQPLAGSAELPYSESNLPTIPEGEKSGHVVSAVVYRQRDTWARETIASVAFQSNSPLEKEAVLTFATPEIPDIRSGWWVLLYSDTVDFAAWCRIVSVSEDHAFPLERHVTIAGGDWPQVLDASNNLAFPPTVAVVTENVVGVYTEKLER